MWAGRPTKRLVQTALVAVVGGAIRRNATAVLYSTVRDVCDVLVRASPFCGETCVMECLVSGDFPLLLEEA